MTQFRAAGWTTHVAVLGNYIISPGHHLETKQGDIEWDRIEIEDLYWSQTAHLLILQGAPLQKLFMECSLHVEGETEPYPGPFIYLQGTVAKPEDPPPRAEKVVLARIVELPCEMPFMDVFGALLKELKTTLVPPSLG